MLVGWAILYFTPFMQNPGLLEKEVNIIIVEKTTALCNRCDCSHEAVIEKRENCIIATVYCPKGDYEYNISSNAEMFLEFRKRSFSDLSDESKGSTRFVLNYISITNACNFNCAVCGANAKSKLDEAHFLSVDEILRRAEQIKRNRGRILHLIGGEPTIHPDIFEIIKRISKKGFATGMVTNGYLLGKNVELARKLKKFGLKRICMQFDSLDEETLREFRRDHLKEKRNAIRNVIRSRLKLGLNCTVTKHNLSEIGELLAHGLKLGNCVQNMTFASAAPVGRYLFSSADSADREQIVTELLNVGDRYHFTFDDFFPLPTYLPWGVLPHPDCGVHIMFVRKPGDIRPLNYYVDIKKLYRYMSYNRMKSNIVSRNLIPLIYLLRAVRKSKLFASIKIVFGLL